MKLFTPISNAIEVYKKRHIRDHQANYEHVWRLVHLQEALIVTLGALVYSRLLETRNKDTENVYRDMRNKARSFVTGYSDDPEVFNTRMPRSESCLSGSLGAWVSFLGWFANHKMESADPVLLGAREYLKIESNLSDQFANAFRRISFNADSYSGKIPLTRKFEAINSMRNKLAHVPLPFDLIEPLHKGLRQELFSAVIKDYDIKKENIDSYKFFEILTGQLIGDNFIIAGTRDQASNNSDHRPEAGNLLVESKTLPNEPWKITPFFHVDDVLNVSLLFRAPDYESGEEVFRVEYHRFAAEATAVREERVSNSSCPDWDLEEPDQTVEPETIIVQSSASESGAPQNEGDTLPRNIEQKKIDEETDPNLLKSFAISAYEMRRHDNAMKFFDFLQKSESHLYNEATALKHGHSALILSGDHHKSNDERSDLLKKAERLLERAKTHRDYWYQADALYNLSKVEYRRTETDAESASEHFKKSIEYIDQALAKNDDSRFETWRLFLEEKQAENP